MIIVSQDKKSIYNFDSLKSIDVLGTGIYISDNILEAKGMCIAEYDTEEEAKEVLQKILKSYRHYRTAECDGYTNVLEETAVFEMPEAGE